MMAGNIMKVFESSAEYENTFISVSNLLFEKNKLSSSFYSKKMHFWWVLKFSQFFLTESLVGCSKMTNVKFHLVKFHFNGLKKMSNGEN